MDGAKVNILLSTFCGESYLPDQLSSIVEQKNVDWHLFWRDDGSNDRSVDYVQKFSEKNPRCVTSVDIHTGRIGAAKAYMALLEAAPEDGFFAFCDQDDVWLPDKLSRAIRKLQQSPAHVPALYCTRQRLVDQDLKPIGLSPSLRYSPSFGNALVQNIASGCTIVMNAAARRVILAVQMPDISVHDWWAYLLVTGAGGRVIFDNTPSILYRQHRANAIGSSPSPFLRARGVIQRGPLPFLRILAAHLKALDRAILTSEAHELISLLRDIEKEGFILRAIQLRRAGLRRQGILEDILLWAWLGFYRYPRRGNETSALFEKVS
jgi:glycosyltransferase involved in cell wall biosynthesis